MGVVAERFPQLPGVGVGALLGDEPVQPFDRLVGQVAGGFGGHLRMGGGDRPVGQRLGGRRQLGQPSGGLGPARRLADAGAAAGRKPLFLRPAAVGFPCLGAVVGGDGEGAQPVEPVSMSCQVDHAAAQRVAVEGAPIDGGEGVEQRRERIDGALRRLTLSQHHRLVHMFDYGMGEAVMQGYSQVNGRWCGTIWSACISVVCAAWWRCVRGDLKDVGWPRAHHESAGLCAAMLGGEDREPGGPRA